MFKRFLILMGLTSIAYASCMGPYCYDDTGAHISGLTVGTINFSDNTSQTTAASGGSTNFTQTSLNNEIASFNASVSSYTDTRLTATITPSSNTKKIKVTVSFSAQIFGYATQGNALFSVFASTSNISTNIATRVAGGDDLARLIDSDTVGQPSIPLHITIIDNPQTTSPITYILKAYNAGADGSVTIGATGLVSTILVEEI
jgi:hypothetical protein